jgi:ATP-dependent DNA ligase
VARHRHWRSETALLPAHAKIRILPADLGQSRALGPDWFHEIKYDGYRRRVERDGASVKLITKGGYD